MTIYRVKAPNGKVYRIEGPPGATAAQLGAFIRAHEPEASRRAPPRSGGAAQKALAAAASFAGGIDKPFVNMLVGAGQMVGVPQRFLTAFSSKFQPTGASGAAGEGVGDALALALPADKALELAAGVGRLAPAAAAAIEGAGFGALTPARNAAQRALDTAGGALGGVLLGGAPEALAALTRPIADLLRDPEAAAARVLRMRLGKAADDLRAGAEDQVPGVVRTPAQAAPQNARVVKEERLMRNGELGPQFDEADQRNDDARKAYLQRFILTADVAKEDARIRRAFTDRYIDTHLKGKAVPLAPIRKLLRAQAAEGRFTPGVAAELGKIESGLVADALPDGKVPLTTVLRARNALADVRRSLAVSSGTTSATAEHFLQPVEDALTAPLEALGGGFRAFTRTYRNLSKAMDSSDAIAAFMRSDAMDTKGRLSAAKFKQFVERNEKAKRPLRSAGMDAVKAVRDSLLNEAKAARRVGASGSNTAADTNALLSSFLGSPYSRKLGGTARLGAALGSEAVFHAVPGFGLGGFIPGELAAEAFGPRLKAGYIEALAAKATDASAVADMLKAPPPKPAAKLPIFGFSHALSGKP